MISLLSMTKDIFYKLATEEYLLKQKEEDFLMIWQSEACIVVGKHQNALAEVNFNFIRDRQIPVARRLSGGGTVFHGEGNLNFTFIRKGEKGKLVDFRFFVSPVVDYLGSLGVVAKIGEKNDLLIGDLKISGNAEHVFKERVLHHGTLLFDADLDLLNRSIEVVPGRFRSKAVQSNRSRVTNIKDHLSTAMSFEGFRQGLFTWLTEYFKGSGSITLTPEDDRQIRQLRDTKYATRDWIWGYSPDFQVRGSILFEGIQAEITCYVERGSVSDCTIRNESLPERSRICDCLTGKEFDHQILQQDLQKSGLSSDLADAVLSALFQ